MRDELGLFLADRLQPAAGVRMLTGTVTDDSVWPPLIATDGGAGVATPVVHGYKPTNGDPVLVLTDWNGRFSSTRICVGQLARASGCLLLRSANQSATGSATTTVSWDTETEDLGGLWAAGTPTTITVPAGAGGTWAVAARVQGAGAWTGGSRIVLQISGLSYGAASTGTNVMSNSVTRRVGATSTITVDVFNNGTAQNFTARLDVYRVA